MFNQIEVVFMLVVAIAIGYLLSHIKCSSKLFDLKREHSDRMLSALKLMQLAKWQINHMQKRLDEYEKKS